MQVLWRSSHIVLRSRHVRSIALFAAAGVAVYAQPSEGCDLRNAEMVRTIDLDACRPTPVSDVEKAAALRSLPTEGAVTQFGASERRKLDAVSRVLRAHARDSVYDIKVITVPQMWTGLYEKVVVLISLRTLTLLNSEELQALVAHEIGHEYVWRQYADAKSHRDAKRLRELELVCDAIAVRTLAREGVSPHRLETAIEKTSWYNREQFGVPLNEGDYPSIKERRQLIKNMSLLEK